jgi:hypothetical protein
MDKSIANRILAAQKQSLDLQNRRISAMKNKTTDKTSILFQNIDKYPNNFPDKVGNSMEIICRISSKNIVIIQNMSINSVVDGRERCLRPYFPLSLSFFLLLKIIQLKKKKFDQSDTNISRFNKFSSDPVIHISSLNEYNGKKSHKST